MSDFIRARFAAAYRWLPPREEEPEESSDSEDASLSEHSALGSSAPGSDDDAPSDTPSAANRSNNAAPSYLLVRPRWLLTAAPERSWEHQTAQFNLIARAYGEDEPTGNARLTLAFEVARRAPSVAQLERELRCHELALNLHRRGILTLQEAWHGGAPLLTTRWQCTINACTPRRLTSEDAPPLPGAWGAIAYELILTQPEQA